MHALQDMTSTDSRMENTLSKAFLNRLNALSDVKGRRKAGLFVAEGTKCVCDLARTFDLCRLLATQEWLDEHPGVALRAVEITTCSRAMLREATRLTATPPVMAIFRLPPPTYALPDPSEGCIVALDCVQDPGNLGTIVRTCNWMGVRNIVASVDTVDVFNPKTVQASMGAIADTRVVYTDLPRYLETLPEGTPVYGTFLDGADAFAVPFARNCVLVMGNEGNGICPEVEAHVDMRVTIPAAPGTSAESLNVGAATAMLLAIRQKCLSDN